MLEISSEQRRALRARAHALHPVVAISQNGLTESVLKEISVSLESHELIKIRVFNDDRTQRDAYLATICEQLGAAPVQHIGKLLVVWRPASDAQGKKAAKARTPRRSPAQARRSKRSFQSDSN